MIQISRQKAGPVQGWAQEADTLCTLRVAYTLGTDTNSTPLTLYVKITSMSFTEEWCSGIRPRSYKPSLIPHLKSFTH
jgi:hypothetical protein